MDLAKGREAMSSRKAKSNGLSERLVKLMDDNKITIREASAICDVPTTTVQGWRTGVMPSSGFDGLARLAQRLGCTLEYLLTGKNLSRPGVADVFADGGNIFDGYLKVKIERVIPRDWDEKEDHD